MNSIRAEGRLDHQALVNSHFERAASYWSDVYGSDGVDAAVYQTRLQRVLSLVDGLAHPPSAAVLEIGPGAGHATVALARRGFFVLAVDAVAAMVEATRDRAETAGHGRQVTAQVADIRALPLADESVSLALAVGVLPWLPAPAVPLRQIARVLRRGGHAIVTVENRWGLKQLAEPYTNPLLRPAKETLKLVLQPFRRPHDRGLTHAMSIRACDALLRASGLRKLAGCTLGFGSLTAFNHALLPRSMGLSVHRRLQSLADDGNPLLANAGAQYIVLAQRE
ncbi:MAG: class I SAM-dependent methyltransferase [Stellaceae bacterium]